MSLALSTLVYEWRRYMAAVIALAFSGLLVLAQVGMFLGIGEAFTAQVDRSRADVMVLQARSKSLVNTGGLPRRLMPLIYMHPDVAQVSDIDGGGGMWQNFPTDGSERKREGVSVTAIDAVPGALTVPTDYPESLVEALQEPYAVAVDQTALARLGVQVGDRASLNGRTVRVRAVLTGYPNMMAPNIVMSRQSLRLLRMAYGADRVGPMLVQLRDPSRADQVVRELNAQADGRYRAWTRRDLAAANQSAMFEEQIIGVMLGFSVFLGFLIGIGITSQTLRGAVLANIKELASLRALGVSMGSLRLIVMELSFWVGVVGLAATALLTTGVTALAAANGVPMAFNVPVTIGVGVLLMVISALSGLMSLGVLKKSQPADLLR